MCTKFVVRQIVSLSSRTLKLVPKILLQIFFSFSIFIFQCIRINIEKKCSQALNFVEEALITKNAVPRP